MMSWEVLFAHIWPGDCWRRYLSYQHLHLCIWQTFPILQYPLTEKCTPDIDSTLRHKQFHGVPSQCVLVGCQCLLILLKFRRIIPSIDVALTATVLHCELDFKLGDAYTSGQRRSWPGEVREPSRDTYRICADPLWFYCVPHPIRLVDTMIHSRRARWNHTMKWWTLALLSIMATPTFSQCQLPADSQLWLRAVHYHTFWTRMHNGTWPTEAKTAAAARPKLTKRPGLTGTVLVYSPMRDVPKGYVRDAFMCRFAESRPGRYRGHHLWLASCQRKSSAERCRDSAV